MNDYLCGLTGRIVTPWDPLYNRARQGYNAAIQQYPLVIVYCRNRRDVANAVLWARHHGVPLRVRSGGHNYEGYSNGKGTLIIDVSEMNRLKLDEGENILYAQGGVTNKQVYEFVSSRGYPFPGGTCPTVGVSGYATGGGWGLSCRYLGLGCDSLQEIQLINDRGVCITASRSRNPDLFWACRGAGGGNYGVVVSMKFSLPQRVGMVTLMEIDWLHVSSREQEAFLSVWQRWLKTADPRATLISRIYNSPNDGLAMLTRGIFYGSPLEAKRIMAPFLHLPGGEASFQYLTFLQAINIIGSGYPPFEKFQSASRFVHRDFSPCEIQKLVSLIRRRAPGSVFAGLSMYALGGRVAQVPRDSTAFFYRDARYILWLETVWEENRFAEANRHWVNVRFPTLASVTWGSYVNFPYNLLPDYLGEYYGAHVGRLRWVKAKYDPYNVFTFPQGIGGRGAAAPVLDIPIAEEDGKHITRAGDEAYRGFRYVRSEPKPPGISAPYVKP